MTLSYQTWESPLGKLHLVARLDALVSLDFNEHWPLARAKLKAELVEDKNPLLRQAVLELDEYFSGKRNEFTVAISPAGTEFQQAAWKALRKIPFGRTISYGEQARRMKNPKAVRAVGRANGQNPIAIIIPCHRVIGGNGSLTGYAGGLGIKKALLELEDPAATFSFCGSGQSR